MRVSILTTLAISLLLGLALAHPTIVLGTLESEPANPSPGDEVHFTVHMTFPTGVPVEQAVVHLELYPQAVAPETIDDPDAAVEPALRARLSETAPGYYQVAITAPAAGTWTLLLRDQTYPWEDTTARLSYAIGGDGNPAAMDFLFPPTAPGPRGLWTWLFWLVGLPLVAGLILTILVLKRMPPSAAGKPQPPRAANGTQP
jgi:hypothetical protein